MPAKLRALAAALVILAAAGLAGCVNKPTEINPIPPVGDGLSNAYVIDTFSLAGGTYSTDSSLASELSGSTIGDYYNPITGRVISTPVMNWSPPAVTGTLDATLQFDSLVIAVPYVWWHRAQRSLAVPGMQIDVHPLLTPLQANRIYLERDAVSWDASKVLATQTLRDTNNTYPSGTLRFKLLGNSPDDYGPRLLAIGQAGGFSLLARDIFAFQQAIPGIAFVPKTPNGPVSLLNLSSATVKLYAHNLTGDTISRTFSGYYSKNFAYTTVDRSNTETAPMGTTGAWYPASATNNHRVYVQAHASLWGQVRFPWYAAFRKQHPELSLVKAELELTSDPNTGSDEYLYSRPLPRMIPWQGSADHLSLARNGNYNKGLPNGTSSDFTVRSSFLQMVKDTTAGTYKIDLTTYLLAVEKGTVLDAGILLSAPIDAPYLVPYTFSLDPNAPNRSRLRCYFVQLDR